MRATSWFQWGGMPSVDDLVTRTVCTARRRQAAVRVQRAHRALVYKRRQVEDRRASAAILITAAARGVVTRHRLRKQTEDLVWELFENGPLDQVLHPSPSSPQTSPQHTRKAFRKSAVAVSTLTASLLLLILVCTAAWPSKALTADASSLLSASKNVTQPLQRPFPPIQEVHEPSRVKEDEPSRLQASTKQGSASTKEAITTSHQTVNALARYVNETIHEASITTTETVRACIATTQHSAHALTRYVNETIRETGHTAVAAVTVGEEKTHLLEQYFNATIHVSAAAVIVTAREVLLYLNGLVSSVAISAIKAVKWLQDRLLTHLDFGPHRM